MRLGSRNAEAITAEVWTTVDDFSVLIVIESLATTYNYRHTYSFSNHAAIRDSMTALRDLYSD